MPPAVAVRAGAATGGPVPKHELLFDVGEYAPVADRITLFYARFPMGRITTRLIARTEDEILRQCGLHHSMIARKAASMVGVATA